MKFSDVLFQVIDLARKANTARALRVHVTRGYPLVTSVVQVQGNQVHDPSGLVAVPVGSSGLNSPDFSPDGSGTPIMLLPVPEEIALSHFLETQSTETVYMLTAVMYLGRNDFDASKLLYNYSIMGERFGGPKWAARQMADKLSLPQFLEEGWRKVTQAGIDLDAMVSTETARVE